MIKHGLAYVSVLVIMTGCGQNVPIIEKNMNNEDKCANIDNKLIQVDQYIIDVEKTSAFHLEEAAIALRYPQISNSNNKKDMLKDANNKKAELTADYEKYGCKAYK
jgi:hypothetical protein